jgi:hypothetical protein
MDAKIAHEYLKERQTGTLARIAIANARTRLAWYDAEWDEHSEPEMGEVRLRVVPDECADLADLEGDRFNPRVNPDIPVSRLEREQQEFHEKVEREGVYGIVGEYFDGETWQHADSCFGFVGDDWKQSGYDTDIMQSTLDAAKGIEVCPTCHRPMLKGGN